MAPTRILIIIALSGFMCLGATAQVYPVKPVRVVAPFAPGSATDIAARAIGQKLTEFWGQQVVVENRTGAGGSIGTAFVARSPSDGYTLLVHTNGYVVNSALYSKLPYDPLKDFIAISPLVWAPFVLVVPPTSGVRSVSDLIAAAKARPGHLNYSSPGIGGAGHLVTEKFRLAAGIDVVHVPNKGAAEAAADVMAGRVDFLFSPITTAVPLVRDHRLVALAMSSARRSSLLPEVPPVAEAGLPGFDETFWTGLWAPAATPTPIVDKLAKDVTRALSAPELRERFRTMGAEPMSMTPTEFARFVRAELDGAVRVVKASGMKVE